MPALGVTGGIASGKTTVTRLLSAKLSADVYDSDGRARALAEDPAVLQKIALAFGEGILTPHGQLDRSAMRAIVFSDAGQRKKLEGIFHPLIRAEWKAKATEARAKGLWLIVDIPLLFETKAEDDLDVTLAVACSEEVQIARLETKRGMERSLASKIISAQIDPNERVRCATHVIWNDSNMENLEQQVDLLSRILIKRHG